MKEAISRSSYNCLSGLADHALSLSFSLSLSLSILYHYNHSGCKLFGVYYLNRSANINNVALTNLPLGLGRWSFPHFCISHGLP